jgi:hypothetical protein
MINTKQYTYSVLHYIVYIHLYTQAWTRMIDSTHACNLTQNQPRTEILPHEARNPSDGGGRRKSSRRRVRRRPRLEATALGSESSTARGSLWLDASAGGPVSLPLDASPVGDRGGKRLADGGKRPPIPLSANGGEHGGPRVSAAAPCHPSPPFSP